MFSGIRSVGRRSGLVAVALGLTGLLAAPVGLIAVTPAAASVGVCRSDPVFTLSNGKVITLNESITDLKSDITGGSYVLHIPKGVKVSSISYSGAVGKTQNMTWTADQVSGSFTATSTVTTTTQNIPVTAYMTIGSKNSTSNTGVSNQAIPNSLTT